MQLHKELIWSYSLLLNHDLSLLFILSSLPPCSKSSIIVSSTLIITTRLSFIPSPDVLLPSLPAIFPRAHLSLLSFSLFPSYNFLSSLPFSWLCRRKKKSWLRDKWPLFTSNPHSFPDSLIRSLIMSPPVHQSVHLASQKLFLVLVYIRFVTPACHYSSRVFINHPLSLLRCTPDKLSPAFLLLFKVSGYLFPRTRRLMPNQGRCSMF